MTWLKRILARSDRRDITFDVTPVSEGLAPPSRDTLAAIGELSRAVKNNPDAVEIYLALGNLYRSQGEIERAIQIRNTLIVRSGLEDAFKARAYFELGRDFKRAGFLDRAANAFKEALALSGSPPDPNIIAELGRLYAESGEFAEAAELFSRLDHAPGQAHFLVRQASELMEEGAHGKAKKLIEKALDIYPGSPEAWLAKLAENYRKGHQAALSDEFAKAVERIRPELRFILIEELMCLPASGEKEEGRKTPAEAYIGMSSQAYDASAPPTCSLNSRCNPVLSDALLPVIEKFDSDVLLCFYGALLLRACERKDEAASWLEKTLMLSPDFWPARLELLDVNLTDDIGPMLHTQVDFFIERAREVKRFVCSVCGLKREQTFFVCPRCRSWHSISFRMNLTE